METEFFSTSLAIEFEDTECCSSNTDRGPGWL